MNERIDADPLDAGPTVVRATFECEAVPGPWHVRRATITEKLSTPYRIGVSLVTETTTLDIDELVGAACELALERASERRVFTGVILRAHYRGVHDLRGAAEVLAVDLEVGPTLALAEQRVDCRVFHGETVPEIVRQVVAPSRHGLGPRLDTAALTHDYEPPRDYCVQYRESDLAYATRLLHEEGIAYVFVDEEGDAERIRFVDDEAAFPALAGPMGLRVAVDAHLSDGEECFTQFAFHRASRPDRAATRHYDWLAPPHPVQHEGEVARIGSVAANEREVYLPSERRTREINEGADVHGVHDDSARHLEHQRQILAGDDLLGHGRGHVLQLAAGMVFEVDHAVELPRMVATEVVHDVLADADALDADARYDNHFVCLPASRFRAALPIRPRPRMAGPQTGTVVGPAGDDIHTDAHGRIHVRMHWDRNDHDPTVWVPVAQSWAGARWGASFLPRVGMEVMVEFLDGNPDRPVVVGCLYNGRNPPPHTLPQERTRSGIRTRSSPDNGGFNELRFEDLAEREEVYLRAQRDLREEVRHDHRTRVDHDQTHEVGHVRRRVVGGDEHVTIRGNRHVVVEGNGEEGLSGHTMKVSREYELDVEARIVIRCQGSCITMTPDRIELQAGGGAKIVLDAHGLIESAAGSLVRLDDDATAEASTGANLVLDAEATMTSRDAAQVRLRDDATIRSGADAHARFEATKVTVTSGDAALTVDGAQAVLDGDEIGVQGASKVTLEGGGARTSLSGGNAAVN